MEDFILREKITHFDHERIPERIVHAGVAARQDARDDQAKVRAKPELFAEHYNQAKLFFDSQTPVEQAHIAAAFRFEPSKLTVPAARTRMFASLRNASEDLADEVAQGLNMPLPEPLPLAPENPPAPEVRLSPALSLMARPGDGSIAGRKAMILVADAVAPVLTVQASASAGAQALIAALGAPRDFSREADPPRV